MVAHTYSPSYSWDWSRRIAWTREAEVGVSWDHTMALQLGNRARLCLKKKSKLSLQSSFLNTPPMLFTFPQSKFMMRDCHTLVTEIHLQCCEKLPLSWNTFLFCLISLTNVYDGHCNSYILLWEFDELNSLPTKKSPVSDGFTAEF